MRQTVATRLWHIIVDVNRLNQEQRLALRAKAFREASIPLIVKHVMRLRISDAEVLQLADRMPRRSQLEPGVAVCNPGDIRRAIAQRNRMKTPSRSSSRHGRPMHCPR